MSNENIMRYYFIFSSIHRMNSDLIKLHMIFLTPMNRKCLFIIFVVNAQQANGLNSLGSGFA